MLSNLVVCYLFLGGAGAGACFVSAALGLLSPRSQVEGPAAVLYRRLMAPGFAAACVLLLLGTTCLALDLGRADRLLLLVTSPKPAHITVGAYALASTLVLAALLGLSWARVGAGSPQLRGGSSLRSALEVLALASALVTMAYTGLLLRSVAAVPLWATPWLPVLFVLSSLSCGVAVLMALSAFTGVGKAFRRTFSRLVAADAALIALEALAAALVVAAGGAGGGFDGVTATAAVASSSVEALLEGAVAPVFWGAFAFAGLAVPFVLDVAMARAGAGPHVRASGALAGPYAPAACSLATAACVLTGGFALRFCLVEAGMHPMLSAAGVM